MDHGRHALEGDIVQNSHKYRGLITPAASVTTCAPITGKCYRQDTKNILPVKRGDLVNIPRPARDVPTCNFSFLLFFFERRTKTYGANLPVSNLLSGDFLSSGRVVH